MSQTNYNEIINGVINGTKSIDSAIGDATLTFLGHIKINRSRDKTYYGFYPLRILGEGESIPRYVKNERRNSLFPDMGNINIADANTFKSGELYAIDISKAVIKQTGPTVATRFQIQYSPEIIAPVESKGLYRVINCPELDATPDTQASIQIPSNRLRGDVYGREVFLRSGKRLVGPLPVISREARAVTMTVSLRERGNAFDGEVPEEREFDLHWLKFINIKDVQRPTASGAGDGEHATPVVEEQGAEPAAPIIPERLRDAENYTRMLLQSKNLIFHGAPGTGKSHLAKQIAARIVSDGKEDDYSELTEDQRERVEFVQFHPSYDYSDFVEGLRPRLNVDGSLGFELQDGVFKRFVNRARENFEDSRMTGEAYRHKVRVQRAIGNYLSEHNDKRARDIIAQVRRMLLETDREFNNKNEVANFLGREYTLDDDLRILDRYNEMKEKVANDAGQDIVQPEMKNFVFIIDEVNRGEISKIFGELFFSIDPDYRGDRGSVSTQYANLHANPNEKFYIPENVYIIGTMNDIDRSVDSFDFAMRRRFRFLELKADDESRARAILAELGEEDREEALRRMKALNEVIKNVDALNENYQIGAAYFRKLKDMSYEALWEDNLKPLLREYIRGMFNEADSMRQFERAYKGDGA